MKTVVEEFLDRFKTLNANEIFGEIIEDPVFKNYVTEIIKEDQLQKGINEDGQIIGYYSEVTERISGGEKKAGDPYTLRDTGEFYDSFTLEPLADGFEIDADAQKSFADNLFEKFGTGIIGLTDENLQRVIRYTREKFITITGRKLGLL